MVRERRGWEGKAEKKRERWRWRWRWRWKDEEALVSDWDRAVLASV
jgi:hypothetical protein